MNSNEEYMRQAISLGAQGRITAPPNPWVGCVIVNNGIIVGESFHPAPGESHAEVIALNQAREKSKGSTVYVTLEPCAHYGRTPPCVNALIKAGVQNVVVALKDPDARVQGKGIKLLREAGIHVTEDFLKEEAHLSLEPYLHHRTTGLPFCVAKAAISLDGRIAAEDGSSQWISCAESRADAHLLRAESQAILIGSATAIKDSPSLTVRNPSPLPIAFSSLKPPLRVVLDSTARVPAAGSLANTSLAPTLIATIPAMEEKAKNAWAETGAEVVAIPKAVDGMGVDLHALLQFLGKRGILQVLMEGGSKVIASALKQRLINRFVVYSAPILLGDTGRPLIEGMSIPSMKEALLMRLINIKQIGHCVRLDYHLKIF